MAGKIKLKEENTNKVQKQEVRKDLSKATFYTDSVFIRSNKFGVVLDFAQIIGPSDHNIVTSVGMSRQHAHALLNLLKRNLEPEED